MSLIFVDLNQIKQTFGRKLYYLFEIILVSEYVTTLLKQVLLELLSNSSPSISLSVLVSNYLSLYFCNVFLKLA